ncbi:MAG: hypothetical protein JOZ47_05155 [Kutzneria sp.]|nr:hypothetical protein [Kutzneria sp.]
MNKPTVGIIAGLVVAAVLVMTGITLATAETTNDSTSTATQLGQARDALATAVAARDLDGVRAALDTLTPALARVRTDLERGALRPEAAGYLGTAEQQTAELQKRLAGAEPRGGILDSVTGLLGSLLDTVTDLLHSLLGGGASTTTTTPAPTTTTSPPPMLVAG